MVSGRPGLDGPLAQLVVGRSGTVYVVATGFCWHAGATHHPWQDNHHSVGIEAEATGTDSWPAAQYDSLLRTAKALADHYDVPYGRVLGHKEIARPAGRKIDPNVDCAQFRRYLAAHAEEDDLSWDDTVTNAFGAKVQAIQVVNGIEKCLSDLQTDVAKLKLTGGQIDIDTLAAKVADLLAARLRA